MRFFQKFFTLCAFVSTFAMGINCTNALTITDVSSNYWAAPSIVHSIEANYMAPIGNKFYPEQAVTRGEFANAIYNLIKRTPIGNPEEFKDVKYTSPNSASILTLNQLQVVCGYPDGNFKPDSKLKRSEASSIIANVVRGDFWDSSVLNRFKDKKDVPNWATPSYINNIMNDVYVNYPKQDILLPNEYLTRAETAALMVKLEEALNYYKTSFLPENVKNESDIYETGAFEGKFVPVYVGTNTLGEFKNSYKNTVKLYDVKKIIEAGNIVPVKSLQKVDARKVQEGEILTYVSPKDVYSAEGAKLYSEGTKFIGYVDRVEKSYWLKKQHKAYIVFNNAVLNDGTEFPVAGVLYSTYKGDVVLEKNKNSLKIQRDVNKKYSKRNAAIKFTDKLVPVIKYDEKAKDNLFMLITGDMIIPENGGNL